MSQVRQKTHGGNGAVAGRTTTVSVFTRLRAPMPLPAHVVQVLDTPMRPRGFGGHHATDAPPSPRVSRLGGHHATDVPPYAAAAKEATSPPRPARLT